ncbi:hypothetical protein CCR98_09105 [Stenotrophomonas sp. WZN-1]|nr:hypothetical protein CCR98_09105 [Stenotrophomonas sp. WZN-1]
MAAITMLPASGQGERVMACNPANAERQSAFWVHQALLQRDSAPRRNNTIRAPPANGDAHRLMP